ncbi:MAG: hypothetical protein Q9217_006930, partial [Psora testacea]
LAAPDLTIAGLPQVRLSSLEAHSSLLTTLHPFTKAKTTLHLSEEDDYIKVDTINEQGPTVGLRSTYSVTQSPPQISSLILPRLSYPTISSKPLFKRGFLQLASPELTSQSFPTAYIAQGTFPETAKAFGQEDNLQSPLLQTYQLVQQGSSHFKLSGSTALPLGGEQPPQAPPSRYQSLPSPTGSTTPIEATPSPQFDRPSLPLTGSNLSRLEGSSLSSDQLSEAVSSELNPESDRDNDQQGQDSASKSVMPENTVLQMRHILRRNRHYIDADLSSNPRGAQTYAAFRQKALAVLDEPRVSDWSESKAFEVQHTINEYKAENEATFLFFLWKALLNDTRSVLQRPLTEPRTKDEEEWMAQSWTKDHLRYKFNIDFPPDSIAPIQCNDQFERKLLANVPRVAVPKPDIAFSVYQDGFTETECEVFEQVGCSLTGLGSYHTFAAVEAKSMNASLEEAENQCIRSGAAIVYNRRKFNQFGAEQLAKASKPSLAQSGPASAPQPTQQPFVSSSPTAAGHAPTQKDGKIDTSTLAFAFAVGPNQSKLYMNWDLEQDGAVYWHMHRLKSYDYDDLAHLTALHHDLDNVLDWGVGKRKRKLHEQVLRIIKNNILPSEAAPSSKKRKKDEG